MLWRRLPAEFELPTGAAPPPIRSLIRAQAEDDAMDVEFSWVGPLARAAGTVLHAELERLATIGEGAIAELPSRVNACAARLREQGIAPDEAAATAGNIVRRLAELAHEPAARWLLFTTHPQAATELRLSGFIDGQLRNAVVDRSFVDAAGTRWIVDYKTGVHAGGGLEEFIARELQRYASQLRHYAALAGELGPEPVRAGLYFPWLGEFRELDAG
jgi:RecB family exonuclease